MSLSMNVIGDQSATLRAHDGSLVDIYSENGELVLVGQDWRVLLDRTEVGALSEFILQDVDGDELSGALRQEYEQGESFGRERGYEDAESDFSTMAYNALNGPNASPEEFVKMLAAGNHSAIVNRFGGRAA